MRRCESLLDGCGTMDVAEFFVMRRYRRMGTGGFVARWLFERFPGRWQVREIPANVGAKAFWHGVIGGFTGGRYEERSWGDDRWRGPVQFFDSSACG